jgi:hypothetical protein
MIRRALEDVPLPKGAGDNEVTLIKVGRCRLKPVFASME